MLLARRAYDDTSPRLGPHVAICTYMYVYMYMCGIPERVRVRACTCTYVYGAATAGRPDRGQLVHHVIDPEVLLIYDLVISR